MRLFAALLPLILAFVAGPATSAQKDLSSLAATLKQIRATHGVNEMRDAGPELTPVKQALRAWVEGQLPPVPGPADPDGILYPLAPETLTSLSASLNQALNAAGLTCGEPGSPAYRCASDPTDFENKRGYLDRVRIASLEDGRYLLVVTGVGVQCGFDHSAYIYRQGPGRKWTMFFASEQDRYGKDEYAPQNFLSINVSPSDEAWNEPAAAPLIATLGFSPWCSSNWQALYTRLWRAASATPTPRPLIDRTDSLFMGDDLTAAARLTRDDLLVEYRGDSIDQGSLVRSHVAHYLIRPGDRLERVAPIALGPNDFVEEWLTSGWAEAARWIDPAANKSALAALHLAAHRKHILGEFQDSPKQCQADPGLWQVSFSDDPSGNAPPRHFKVRWTAPYGFTLVGAALRPFPGCDRNIVSPADIGTLFPRPGWTP